jgi:hypothetical protein
LASTREVCSASYSFQVRGLWPFFSNEPPDDDFLCFAQEWDASPEEYVYESEEIESSGADL